MPFALLALLLSSSPDPLASYAKDACHVRHREDESNLEMKAKLAEEAACARKAQDADLDRVIVPLKKRAPEKFKAWMNLQAAYNTWADQACRLAELLFWIDLDSGRRSDGTARATTELGCQITLRYERGNFARQLARGRLADWKKAASARARGADSAADELRTVLAAIDRDASRDAGALEPDATEVPIGPAEWAQLRELTEKVRSGPDQLASAQCALLPDWPDCQAKLAAYFTALASPAGRAAK